MKLLKEIRNTSKRQQPEIRVVLANVYLSMLSKSEWQQISLNLHSLFRKLMLPDDQLISLSFRRKKTII